MNNTKFSVSMCVYGGDSPKYFDEAMGSILSQTRLPNEIVLVVDGPVTDDIEHVINKYTNSCDLIKVFRLEKNMGHGIARNVGLSKCTYDYVAIADADDINRPDRFEIQMSVIDENNSLSAISSACYHFTDNIDNYTNIEYLPADDVDIKKYMKSRCPLCQASTILKKSDVERAGGYQDWYHAEDYYLWIRMTQNGATFANSLEPLLYVRSDDSQMKRRGGLKYFISLKRLYGYMKKNHIINAKEYIVNVGSRFIIQVLLPSRIRAYIRKKVM